MSDTPVRIRAKDDPTRLEIEWSDGASTRYTAAEVRRICPCAHCIHELTGQLLLDPASVPDDLTTAQVRMVGNYALAIRFSDGHDTGIYPFAFLRKNDPARA